MVLSGIREVIWKGMEASNRTISERLLLMAQVLEILDENPFKVRAYRRASEIIGRLATPVAGLSITDLDAMEGIGEGVALKVQEIASSGTFRELEEALSRIPPGLIDLLNIEGVGPKTAKTLWQKMNITSVADLERAARARRIRALKGFGEKKEALFLRSIARQKTPATRMNREQADEIIAVIRTVMKEGTWTVAGSYRRGKSTVGDIDIVTTDDPRRVNSLLHGISDEMIDVGDKKTSFRCKGSRVDVRFTSPSMFGSMLLHLTGSAAFNIRMRELAISKGASLNEYGIVYTSQGISKEFSREEEVFFYLGLDFIVPELREDWGEVEAAHSHTLPTLVEQGQIRGDLHVHSSWSDGSMDIRSLARAGEELGYSYLACTDHSSSLGVARGLDEAALKRQAHEIEMVNRDTSCHILHGIEVDILADGSPGLPASALRDLDIVIGSVHSAFSQESDVMTRRIISAVSHEDIDIIGHPTGRLLGQRESYAVDMQRVIAAAAATGTALECNASPFRMDLDDLHIREAIQSGVKISIGTDAHDPRELHYLPYGLGLCRRGWATPSDLLNTLTCQEVLEYVS